MSSHDVRILKLRVHLRGGRQEHATAIGEQIGPAIAAALARQGGPALARGVQQQHLDAGTVASPGADTNEIAGIVAARVVHTIIDGRREASR
jgi:hypothetical protein